MTRVVITGGHHTSALPFIEKLKNDGNFEVYWFGHKFSQLDNKNPTLEFKDITELGIPFHNLIAGKFYNTFNLWRLLKIPIGFFHAFFLLIKIKPKIIISFGGYLAVPTVIVGKLIGIKCVTHEQTLVQGYANKLISRFVDIVFISWEETRDLFSKSKKVIFTGIPIRESVKNATTNDFAFNNNLPVIYITGGKTGAHVINDFVFRNMESLLKIANIIHQTGDNSTYKDKAKLDSKYSEIRNTLRGEYISKYYISNKQIGEVYSTADLIIGRSGAHTVAEVCYLGIPAIFVPIPWVSHNEQLINAQFAVEAGIAEIFEEEKLNTDELVNLVEEMLKKIDKYQVDEDIKAQLGVDSAQIMFDEIKKLI